MAEEGEIALDDSEEEVEEEEEEEEEESGKKEPEITPAKARMNRLFELRMKLNKARSLNKTAVLDEFKRGDDGNQVDWKAKKEEWAEKKKKYEADVEDDTLNPDKDYLNTTAATNDAQEKKKAKKKKKEAAFGWEIFGADAMYNSYKKRVNRLHEDHGSDLKGSYAARKATEAEETFFPSADTLVTVGASTAVDDKGSKRLRKELDDQAERRAKWSRRRQFWEAADVDYINERNKVFNDKIKRAFDPYTREIKQNLERGTALWVYAAMQCTALEDGGSGSALRCGGPKVRSCAVDSCSIVPGPIGRLHPRPKGRGWLLVWALWVADALLVVAGVLHEPCAQGAVAMGGMGIRGSGVFGGWGSPSVGL
eukprot:CAMPEP_0174378468 /NCGR_PEP_ID=MMETSP0811_2-20130205/122067_1 /TAXON_ID=73025 ORGANISM="Eutreptiella gymnastica-like, Strain CCMP1594" /NCGR_SAMPLE_ID=MMETSP0811_2 /ASSEMBLY_ACC=CAM_ASM_000667 /LENGTH=366 /DNA_ID=CAMNT_0015530691 /DNA_START=26 /DNA_END=1127 /DNA_ORIENTATION=+